MTPEQEALWPQLLTALDRLADAVMRHGVLDPGETGEKWLAAFTNLMDAMKQANDVIDRAKAATPA